MWFKFQVVKSSLLFANYKPAHGQKYVNMQTPAHPSHTVIHSLYLRDLQVVELLLPFEDVLQSAQPDVDVTHKDTPANMDSQTVQGRAQVLQQLLDKARIVVVL